MARNTRCHLSAFLMASALMLLPIATANPDEDNAACDHCSHCYHQHWFDVPWMNDGAGGEAELKTLDVSYHVDSNNVNPQLILDSTDQCDSCLGNIHRGIKYALKDIPQPPDQL